MCGVASNYYYYCNVFSCRASREKGRNEKGAHHSYHSWKMHNASSFVLQQIATENAEKKNTGGDGETSTNGRLMCALAAINSDD